MDIAAYSNMTARASDTSDGTSTKKYSQGKQSLTMDDYFQLLAAQLQYQDSNNPMSNSEMMAQLTEMAMVEAMNTSTQTTIITYASGMLNKEATVLEIDPNTGYATGESVTGIVTGVNLSGSSPTIFINDKEYSLSQLMSLGKVPEKPDDNTDPDDGSGDGSGGDGSDTQKSSYSRGVSSNINLTPGETARLRDREEKEDKTTASPAGEV